MHITRTPMARLQLGAVACAAAVLAVTACENGDANNTDHGKDRPKASTPANEDKPQANGIEKKTAAEIYNAAMKANATAGSAHETMERTDTASDLKVSATECVGTVDKRDRGSFDIIRKNSDIWAKPDATLAKELSEAGTTINANVWLHGNDKHPLMKALASYCHSEQFTDPDTASVKMTKKPVTELDGQPVIPLQISAEGGTGTFYVATTGEPHLIKQESSSKAGSDLTFSAFGEPVGAAAPAEKTVPVPN
ncbi:hypothetical protein [Streptomyces sp. NBC_01304]|uniref:hypothetical protein n=1 Tax=Streptomyces sp. NBC_01304 TaxID=2903818 RepID=UPI002E0E3FCF|nr:hypothetical protein OG430_47895 [Streptomyces sp. NBC_01304]